MNIIRRIFAAIVNEFKYGTEMSVADRRGELDGRSYAFRGETYFQRYYRNPYSAQVLKDRYDEGFEYGATRQQIEEQNQVKNLATAPIFK